MQWIARLRMFALASGVAGFLVQLGMASVNAAGGCGTGECRPWSSPAATQNGLPLILTIGASGVVVLGVLLLLVMLYLGKRRSRLGRAGK